jgi:hypothetical protein
VNGRSDRWHWAGFLFEIQRVTWNFGEFREVRQGRVNRDNRCQETEEHRPAARDARQVS